MHGHLEGLPAAIYKQCRLHVSLPARVAIIQAHSQEHLARKLLIGASENSLELGDLTCQCQGFAMDNKFRSVVIYDVIWTDQSKDIKIQETVQT